MWIFLCILMRYLLIFNNDSDKEPSINFKLPYGDNASRVIDFIGNNLDMVWIVFWMLNNPGSRRDLTANSSGEAVDVQLVDLETISGILLAEGNDLQECPAGSTLASENMILHHRRCGKSSPPFDVPFVPYSILFLCLSASPCPGNMNVGSPSVTRRSLENLTSPLPTGSAPITNPFEPLSGSTANRSDRI